MATLDVQSSYQVLIIDERPDALRTLLDLLSHDGINFSIALDAAEGYARAVTLVPDVALISLSISGINSLALTRMLSENPKTSHIPILVTASSLSHHDRLAVLQSGAVGYAEKPLMAQELLALIKGHIRLSARQLARSDSCAGNAVSPAVISEDELLLRAAERQVRTNLMQISCAGELAKSIGVSERKLMNVFRRYLHMSPSEFIRKSKLDKAEYLLVKTSLDMTTIAAEVGYSSAANFSTAFRACKGISPTLYRKKALGGRTIDREFKHVDPDFSASQTFDQQIAFIQSIQSN